MFIGSYHMILKGHHHHRELGRLSTLLDRLLEDRTHAKNANQTDTHRAIESFNLLDGLNSAFLSF